MVSIVKKRMGWFSGISASRVNLILSPIKIDLRSMFALTFTGVCEKQKNKAEKEERELLVICSCRSCFYFADGVFAYKEKEAKSYR